MFSEKSKKYFRDILPSLVHLEFTHALTSNILSIGLIVLKCCKCITLVFEQIYNIELGLCLNECNPVLVSISCSGV
jgi:hypothetical protein